MQFRVLQQTKEVLLQWIFDDLKTKTVVMLEMSSHYGSLVVLPPVLSVSAILPQHIIENDLMPLLMDIKDAIEVTVQDIIH